MLYRAFSIIHGLFHKNLSGEAIYSLYILEVHNLLIQSLDKVFIICPRAFLVGSKVKQLLIHFQLRNELVFHEFHVGIQLLGSGS